MKHLLLLASLILLPLSAQAQKLSVADITGYLNSFVGAKAKFVQANPDKTLAQGVLYIKKPGRIRYEYIVPSDSLVISDGRYLGIFDKKSNRGPNVYDLRKTPLDILLRGNVDLAASGVVRSVKSDGVKTEVTARDPKNPGQGTLTMVFTANPIELRQWIVKDPLGRKTTVILNDLELINSVPDTLFDLVATDTLLRSRR